MHREGHYGASLLAYSPLGFVAVALGFPAAGVGGAALALGLAMVPDWDQRIPGIKHRGVTHTVQFAAVVAVVTAILGAGVAAAQDGAGGFAITGGAVFGAATGAVSILGHIGADALTPMGVEPFGSDGPHYTYDLCRADNPLGNYGLLVLGIAGGFVAFYAGRSVQAALAL